MIITSTSNNPLRDMLMRHDPRTFRIETALSDALSKATTKTAHRYRMRNTEVLGGLTTALVSAVQAMAPVEEWADVGVVLADVIQRRLTVKAN